MISYVWANIRYIYGKCDIMPGMCFKIIQKWVKVQVKLDWPWVIIIETRWWVHEWAVHYSIQFWISLKFLILKKKKPPQLINHQSQTMSSQILTVPKNMDTVLCLRHSISQNKLSISAIIHCSSLYWFLPLTWAYSPTDKQNNARIFSAWNSQ